MGSLQDVLTEKISSSTENFFLEKIKSKMLAGAAMLVTAVRAIESVYGKEGVEVIHNAIKNRIIQLTRQWVEESKDKTLEGLCSSMGSHGTQEWTREGNNSRQSYKFTKCMWAEVFKELNAEDIGLWICEGDVLSANVFSSFNPQINFKRTKTLMQGHNICDHEFFFTDQGDN